MAKVDLFYKSYSKDYNWLYKSLQSVKKYLSGINEIHIVIPDHEKHLLDYDKTVTGFKTTIHFVKEYGNGYLYQQLIKMSAHQYCKADFIMFVDSDCLFTNPTDISKTIKKGKPEILYTHYSKVGDAICWKGPTERFMNMPIEFEFMRRMPLTYHRSTIETIFLLCPFLEDFIMLSKGFSEFNAIGAWAFTHERDKYSFIDTDNWKYTEPLCKQFWSHYRNNPEIDNEIKTILE